MELTKFNSLLTLAPAWLLFCFALLTTASAPAATALAATAPAEQTQSAAGTSTGASTTEDDSTPTQIETTLFDQCLLDKVKQPGQQESVYTLRQLCQAEVQENLDGNLQPGPISRRILSERHTQWNRHVITPHRQNYFLPVTYTNQINRKAYESTNRDTGALENLEAKMQLSFKVPLNSEDLITRYDGLYFGFTMQSWWQVYANSISAPFRETNYQPEIFYITGLDWHPFGGNTGLVTSFEHQSNGQSQPISRSWNRIRLNLMFEKDNYAINLSPWYRLPEKQKATPDAAEGDDNPDIDKFLGNFELHYVYHLNRNEFSMLLRNNLRSPNKGAIEMGWSFPLHRHLKGYIQYFNGYGESLIDYNISQSRIGLGFLITDFL